MKTVIQIQEPSQKSIKSLFPLMAKYQSVSWLEPILAGHNTQLICPVL